MVIDTFDPEYIAKVGFPIAAFVAAFGVVTIITTLIIKNQIKHQQHQQILTFDINCIYN